MEEIISKCREVCLEIDRIFMEEILNPYREECLVEDMICKEELHNPFREVCTEEDKIFTSKNNFHNYTLFVNDPQKFIFTISPFSSNVDHLVLYLLLYLAIQYHIKVFRWITNLN